MKNLLIFLAVISVFVACERTIAKTYECQEFSLTCELKKDRILVMPISFDTTLVDAYGNEPLSAWYIVSTKARAIAPIRIHVYLPGGSVENPNDTWYPTPEQLLNAWGDTKIAMDTVDLSAFVYGLTKALVVVSGVNEVIANDSYNTQANLVRPK